MLGTADVRGTVQADILKDDQGQNACIFSIDFALKTMGDVNGQCVSFDQVDTNQITAVVRKGNVT